MQELSDLVIPDMDVWVPDERGILVAAGELVFNDAPWLGAQQEAAHFVHPKISFEVHAAAAHLVSLAGSQLGKLSESVLEQICSLQGIENET